MAVNVFTILQLAVFAAIVLNVNLHSVSADSKGTSDSQDSTKSIKVDFCETNCTKTDGGWTGCTGDCICVSVGDSIEGRCMDFG
uniref:Evasin P1124 n=1 Tax=Ixodes ricinus TaxID=34613 RepID=E1124_IXORI|nr:RecName: Full=Evasin P1124; Flags: Precursor [Ixodes ricinus]